MEKWTYRKLKSRKYIEVYIYTFRDNKVINVTRYMGIIKDKFKESIPEWNIKKGDFSIIVQGLGKILFSRESLVFNNYKNPCVAFALNNYTYNG